LNEDWLRLAGFALEGSGDLRAAFLKNRRTHDDQEPQSGEEGEGTKSCSHRIILVSDASPFWTCFVPNGDGLPGEVV
jgi:hypothetical protein